MDTFWVAVLDDTVIGYSNLRVLSDEGELERIAVAPDYRRLGIGRKLMEAMEDFAGSKPGQSGDVRGQKPEHGRIKTIQILRF